MKRLLLFLLGVLALSGCTTSSMKGTPFYTGEYEAREGPASNRINLWPIAYYRDPALSVLWPFMEFSPDHLAFRPVYSVYDRSTDHPVYNVLWPVGRFDPANEDYRIFPVYWGDEYFNIVPLYWHKGDPFAGVGHNALFPFWIWNNREDGHSLDVMWPFCAKYDYPDRQGWRVWPLRGSSDKPGSHYCYTAWPLAHHWKIDTNKWGHAVAPLYLYAKEPAHTLFLSLPYSRNIAKEEGGQSWDLTLPLCYREWVGDTFNWKVFPALSWGQHDKQMSNNWYVLGLGHCYASLARQSHHVIPLYYYDKNPEARAFYTLPWWSKKYADGTGWHTLAPLYYRSHSADASSIYTLPWWSKKYADGSGWNALFPVFYQSRMPDYTAFYSLPWLYRKQVDGTRWSTAIPFYFQSRSSKGSAFYSLPWLSEEHSDGSEWQASFPFYFHSASADGAIMLTPLYARKLQGDGSVAWRCYIPLVYLDETKDAHFMTPLGGRWKMGDQHNWLALPLLSGGAKDAGSGRNIWLAGLAGQSWKGEAKSHYAFPLYYAALHEGTFVSPLYAAWRKGDRDNHAVIPLLSGWHTDGEASGSILAGGLAGHRSGDEDAYHYVFPFYYAAPDKSTFVSVPYAAWRAGDRHNRVVPPLLSGWYSDGEASGSVLAAGLAGHRRGDEDAYHYVFPLYYAATSKGAFLSLPYAKWSDGNKQNNALPLLLSGWSVDGAVSDASVLAGLGAWRKEKGQIQRSHVLPLYLWQRDNYFYTALFGKNRTLSYYATPLAGRYGEEDGGSGSWIAPLYWHRQKPSGEIRGNYLLLGYYHKNESRNEYGAFGFYDYCRWKTFNDSGGGRTLVREGKDINYLLLFGQSKERWNYGMDEESGTEKLEMYSKKQSFFPLWEQSVKDKVSKGERLETSALLGLLYDTRHEQKTEEEHDYLRRRVLWRLYHYEKLNGDVSADIFPGVTVDSYQNGYFKCSFLWRMFRYEKDPADGSKKLDLLYIPFRR